MRLSVERGKVQGRRSRDLLGVSGQLVPEGRSRSTDLEGVCGGGGGREDVRGEFRSYGHDVWRD